MIRLGLIGNPVAHSRSPRMHNAVFAALGMDAVYELWPTEFEDVPARIVSVREPGIGGVNVTVPHKERALGLVDEVLPTARRVGAVNTVIPRNGQLIGDNTDAYGYATAIAAEWPEFVPSTAVVLGAGGASRAVIVAMQEMGAGEVIVVNRTYQRAQELANEFGASAADWSELPNVLRRANLVTNATALGWHGEQVIEPELLDVVPDDAVITDLTYANTPLLQAATARGLRIQDGGGMLIHQGVRAFELWFGITPPVDVMTAAAFGTE